METVPDLVTVLRAVVRWASYACVFIGVGACGFRFVALAPVRGGDLIPDDLLGTLERRAAHRALIAALVLVLLHGLRLWFQAHAFFGAVGGEELGIIARETRWGTGWTWQVAAALLAAGTFFLARRALAPGWRASAVAASGLGATLPLTGHAVAETTFSLATVSQVGHVLGAAVWLGTLLMLLWVGVRGVNPLAVSVRGPAMAAMVRAFSPLALVAAALLGASGLLTAFLYLPSLDALWLTGWGRVLLAKVVVVAGVVGAGFYNWRRVRPDLGDLAGERELRRSAAIELGLAAAVLLVTAILVTMQMPGE